MSFRNLIPKKNAPEGIALRRPNQDPFFALEERVNDLIGSVFGGYDTEPFGIFGKPLVSFSPKLEVSDSDKEIVISAELPGLDEKSVEVTLEDDVLTIKGEKKEERTAKHDNGGYLSERVYGSFQRSLALPSGIETEKVNAKFTNGVLKIALPRTAETQRRRQVIDVKGE